MLKTFEIIEKNAGFENYERFFEYTGIFQKLKNFLKITDTHSCWLIDSAKNI